MKKIICTGDFIYSSREKYLKFHSWIFKLFIPIIKESLNTGVDITFDIKDNTGEYFSREYFYNLANQTNIKDCHNIYNIDNFTDEQIDMTYLFAFTLIIKKFIIDSLNIKYRKISIIFTQTIGKFLWKIII